MSLEVQNSLHRVVSENQMSVVEKESIREVILEEKVVDKEEKEEKVV